MGAVGFGFMTRVEADESGTGWRVSIRAPSNHHINRVPVGRDHAREANSDS